MKTGLVIKSRMVDLAQGIGMAFLAAIVSNAQVLGTFSPFGLSFVMAIPREYTLFSMAGSLIGYILFGNISQSGLYLAAILVAGTLKLLVRFKVNKSERKYLIYSIAASVVFFGACIISAAISPVSTITILLYIAETILCGCMTFMLSMVFTALSSQRTEYRLVEKASFALLCVLIFLAFAPFEVSGIRLARIFAVFCMCAAMYRYGCIGGTLVSILFTISMTLYNTDMAISSGFLIIAAFIGGVFLPLGKTMQTIMFIATSTFAAMILGTSQISTMVMVEVFAGTVIFYVFPEKILNKTLPKHNAIKAAKAETSGITSRLDFTASTLSDLQRSIEAVSGHMETIAENDIFNVFTKTSDKVCKKCGLNTFCWSAAYSELMNSLNEMTKHLRTKGKVEAENAPYFFRQKCCQLNSFIENTNLYYKEYLAKEAATRRVTEARLVAISQLEGISSMLCEMSKEFAEVHIPDHKAEAMVNSIFNDSGYSPSDICCYLDRYDRFYCDVYLPERPSDKTLEDICFILQDRLDRDIELPSIISSNSNTKVSYFEQANFSIDFHSSQISNRDNKYCGDSYEYFTDSKGFAHIILSDGMGSGPRAAVDSTMTCSIAHKLLQTGFGFDAAFQLVNLSFLVKSRDESLATLDVCSVDLYTGMADFAKAGAASSFVLRGGRATKVECSSLPIGILQGIKYDRSNMKLNNGDIIVLVSDGVIASGDEWINSELELCKNKSAKEISQKLCSEAQRRRIDGHSDDITVISAKIRK